MLAKPLLGPWHAIGISALAGAVLLVCMAVVQIPSWHSIGGSPSLLDYYLMPAVVGAVIGWGSWATIKYAMVQPEQTTLDLWRAL